MKILFHSITYLPELEAVSRRISGLATNLVNMGHTVHVCCGFPDMDKGKRRKGWLFQWTRKEVIDGVRVYRYFTIPYHRKGSIRRLLNNYSFAISGRFHRLRKKTYDVVITSSPPLFISNSGRKIAKKHKAKLVFDIRDIWPDVAVEMQYMNQGGRTHRAFQKMADKMYQHADLITTVSKSKVESLQTKHPLTQNKVRLISNGVDDFFSEFEDNRSFLNKFLLHEFFSVIHVGNIGKAQDIDSFLNLAKETIDDENIRFYLIGDGIECSRILKRIEDENLHNVVYCGKRQMDEVYTAYKYASLSYVSLINENLLDSVPTKLYESLYCGCPVLLSACGESVEVVELSKFGLVSHPKDFEALKRNFDEIHENYESYLGFKDYAYQQMNQEYNRKNITQKLVLELEKLIERK